MIVQTIMKQFRTVVLGVIAFLMLAACEIPSTYRSELSPEPVQQTSEVPEPQDNETAEEVDFEAEETATLMESMLESEPEETALSPEERIKNLVVLSDRSDYPTDESYANFRPVVMGDMVSGVLYRTSAPLVGALSGESRASYVDSCLRNAGIRAVMNMAYTPEEMQNLFAGEDYAGAYYRELYESGSVWTDAMPYSYKKEEFSEGLAAGLSFLAEHEPPWCIHCHGGKDRTGFTVMVLGMLMDAEPEEIIADYMQSYANFYRIEPGTEEYRLIAEKYVIKWLCELTGEATLEEVKGADLPEKAREYLYFCGMDMTTVDRLEERLKTSP